MMSNDNMWTRIRIFGIVQGVGFRPFIRRLALQYELEGTVCNRGSYVEILAKGEKLAEFITTIPKEAPKRSAILKLKSWDAEEPTEWTPGDFIILGSEKELGMVFVSPDIATCPECEAELLDPNNRRYLHPFINCTACGPRLTILDSMPYDRIRTSMAEFPMCPDCESEYTDIKSRRYHAQPVCCNHCGPELYLLNWPERSRDAMAEVRRVIRGGGIVAIKGVGGFHLCCDGTSDFAVARLRALKNRPYKPFAVMMRNMDVVRRECQVPGYAEKIMTGPQKPILLLPRRDGEDEERLCEQVAPGNPNVGVMLPYTPVHRLLFDDPDAEGMPDILVMTSGNPSGAPICMTDEEADRYLSPMCDRILSNNRQIRIRADDSVMSLYQGKPYMIRRSRGYAPIPTVLSESYSVTALGIGGELKNTFTLLKEDMAYPSPYIGDMADVRSVDALKAAVVRMERLLEIQPQVIGCDYHPGYNTGVVAREMAAELGVPCVPVQHHYAHIASCMAENEWTEKVIGVSFDGTGYGTDDTIWGGEILLVDYDGFERVGSIRPFIHAGGDKASKECWRIAVSILGQELAGRLNLGTEIERRAIQFMLENEVNVIPSTSAGRLFDAVSSILGLKQVNSFEGEMSMRLQFEAEACKLSLPENMYEGPLTTMENGFCYLETTELIRDIAAKALARESSNVLAQMFHQVLADMITEACVRVREESGIQTVALSGGVFQNVLLLGLTEQRLERKGFRVLTHSLVPANDGGIALGQAVIAARRLQQGCLDEEETK